MTRSRTLGGSMAHGIAWMLLFKVVDRAVGFVSVIVLARLLVPADFGLIALAMSAIALLDALGAFGLETALIQRADARREHFDAVWSFNVANGALTGAVGIAIAWWVAAFYGDERLVAVMFVLSIARIVRGFENVGVVAFRKEMEFDREFRYLVAKRLTTTVLVTLPLAFVLHNYWALLIGTLAGTSIGVALSYAMHPFRPRLSFAGIGPLLHFSKWLYLTSLIEFAHGRVADVMVGRWTGAAAVGSLAMARELARFPTQELSAPVNRAVFPGYVKLAGDRGGLRRGYLKVTSALLLMILPAGVGLSLLAEPVTRALIGEKWLAAIPLIQVLSINGIMGVLLGTAYHVNLAVGMSRSTTMVLAIKIAIALPLMFWTIPEYGAQGAVLSMFVALLATMPLNWLLLRRAIEFGWSEVAHILWRPLAGTVAMSVAVFATRYAWPTPCQVVRAGRLSRDARHGRRSSLRSGRLPALEAAKRPGKCRGLGARAGSACACRRGCALRATSLTATAWHRSLVSVRDVRRDGPPACSRHSTLIPAFLTRIEYFAMSDRIDAPIAAGDSSIGS